MRFFPAALALFSSYHQVQGISESQVRDTITGLQRSYLDNNAVNDPVSYQGKAMAAAIRVLTNQELLNEFINANDFASSNFDWDENRIKNYYVAACIYFATNGIENVQTIKNDIPIVDWENTDNWIENPNYCSWRGVSCFFENEEEESDGHIKELKLNQNNLYGTFPSEVGLIGDELRLIDLYENQWNYCIDYSWFEDMEALEYLWFGSTAWYSPGVPADLAKLSNLRQLDMGYSYWGEGPIRNEAFVGLEELEYIKMSFNTFHMPEGQVLPPSIYELPKLIRLYMEQVQFYTDYSSQGGERWTPTLDFVSELDGIIEAWFDGTEFSGGIPEMPESMKSFGCVSCGLTGNLDNLTGDANLNRVWLTSNDLEGDIPDDIATVNSDLTRLQLEGNSGVTGTFPQNLCDKIADLGGQGFLGGNSDVCADDSCCTCVDVACGQDLISSPPTAPPAAIPVGFCFSGESLVEVQSKGLTKMSDVAVGDIVRVSNDEFAPIYAFGHKNDVGMAKYLRINTEGNRTPLEISDDHMLSIENNRFVPASTIKKGDMLVTASGDLAEVTGIKTVTRTGVYAPFTSNGKIVVNDIVASNYIAYQGSEYLSLGDIQTPFSYQWIAHSFNSIHRLANMMGFRTDTYTEEGVSNWVNIPHRIFSWTLGQNKFVACALILPAIFMIGFTSMLESLILTPFLTAIIVGALTFYRYNRGEKAIN